MPRSPVHLLLYPPARGPGGSPYPCGAPATEEGSVGVRRVRGCGICEEAARKEHAENLARRAARGPRRRVRVLTEFGAFSGGRRSAGGGGR